MRILTAVILNEGLCYDEEERAFNAQKHHKGAHLDFFFCWNQPLKDALEKTGFADTRIEVVGNPRHDFYFPPWSETFVAYPKPDNGRPLVLLCTNFGLAGLYEQPRSEIDKFFAPWKDRISYLHDYMSLVSAHHRYRERVLAHLGGLLRSEKFNVILRPHPREPASYYEPWLAKLPKSQRALVRLDAGTNLTPLLVACDLAIGCENCNTTLEAWIARKPAIELIFEKHPVLFNEDVGKLSPHCADSGALVAMVERELRDPQQAAYADGRRRHLTKWCNSPSGQTTSRVAQVVAEALKTKPSSDWSQLTVTDRRRALKLKAVQKIGHAYHYKPLLGLRGKILGGRSKLRASIYAKSIRPRDVRRAMRLLETRLQQPGNNSHEKR
jgi:surface carbohydrate biosynthesis protein